MARTTYALPVDVIRKFDPGLTQSDLDSNSLFGNDDNELLYSYIEAAERKFDERTGHPFRETRQGVSGEPRTYELKDADFWRYQDGTKIWLDHYPAVPLSSTEGDALEIRTGRDTWRDITDDEGTLYEADWMEGTITIYAARYRGSWRNAAFQNNIRINYRYGAFGGRPGEGGQTELASDTTGDGTDTTLDVTDASRLPPTGIVNLGGVEYAHMTSRDADADTITVTRGTRYTDASGSNLTTGDTVHYCPENIRDAVAARAARELIKVDHIGDNLPTPDDDLTFSDLIEDLEKEWSEAIAENAEAKML